jgi:hypothetical protein
MGETQGARPATTEQAAAQPAAHPVEVAVHHLVSRG